MLRRREHITPEMLFPLTFLDFVYPQLNENFYQFLFLSCPYVGVFAVVIFIHVSNTLDCCHITGIDLNKMYYVSSIAI